MKIHLETKQNKWKSKRFFEDYSHKFSLVGRGSYHISDQSFYPKDTEF